MHPTHHESAAAMAIDVSGLWFCPRCGDIHRRSTCPTPKRRFWENEGLWKHEARTESDVRLCACCARTAVRCESAFASFFCDTCTPGVLEINRSVGRLVVPICRDPDANRAILPLRPDGKDPVSPAADPARFLSAQIQLLASNSFCRTLFLLDRLRILDGEPIALDRFLREVVQLRHESFHAQAALRELASEFHEYLLEIPSESPALAARVEKKALAFARLFRVGEARRLLDKGVAAVQDVARNWAWKVVDEVLPIPGCVAPDAMRVLERRSCTILALQRAAVASLERAHGPTRRPAAPAFPPRLPAMVLSRPGEEWPEYLPQACPQSARLVVGLERTPAQPDIPLSTYHLSMDRRHRWWVLWGHVVDEDGCMEPAPVAWCVRSGLAPVDAAFVLLELSLKKDRETHGTDRARPEFGMPGLLGEDLANVLLDLVWAKE